MTDLVKNIPSNQYVEINRRRVVLIETNICVRNLPIIFDMLSYESHTLSKVLTYGSNHRQVL